MSDVVSRRDFFMAVKWAALAQEVSYQAGRLDRQLHEAGVRGNHAADGDQLGDSPEASMVRVHARAALGALAHLAASLETLATKLDPDEDEE